MTRWTLVTGTDTGVGKTVATAALAAAWSVDRRVGVVKPVQTGLPPRDPGDADEVTRLSGVVAHELLRLPEALAPESAAWRSGAVLPTVVQLAQRAAAVADALDTVLVEGSGGVAVRLDSAGGTLLDLGTALSAYGEVDVVVVVRATLGTLNHTELTVDAVRRAGLRVSGLIIGWWPADPGTAEWVGAADVARLTGLPVLASLPAGAGRLGTEQFRGAAIRWLAPSR